MPPQALRYPSPAPAAETGGRHRRPESLADVHPQFDDGDEWTDSVPVADRRIAMPVAGTARHRRVTTTTPDGRTLVRRVSETVPDRRTLARRAAAAATEGGTRIRRGADTLSRTGRHSAAHRAAAGRPPVTGSHRAPGTLPIESWLLMGKKRQQILLASLVAAGLLMIAIPTQHRSAGVDTVNAAAERAAAGHAAKKNQDASSNGTQSGNDRDGGAPAPAASAPAGNPGPAQAGEPEHGLKAGPAHSLRTTGTRAVALTFDDGPDPVQTPQILALLDQYHIKATFCLVGQQVEKHPEVVRQIVAAGHTLCNHTWNHSLTIGKQKPEQIRADLSRTKDAIEAAAPGVRVPFFRAPGGDFTDRLVSVAGEYGMTSLYWEVDPQDWDHQEGETDAAHTARVIADIKKHVKPGSIVLSHDFNQPDTIAAYKKLLPWLTEHFTLGIPGEPVADPTTPPADQTPTESPATPEPATPSTPANAAPDAGPDAKADADATR
jgi:peptidoglycan/xylan/chitin deacetylase (PgdA/CDA1 family)